MNILRYATLLTMLLSTPNTFCYNVTSEQKKIDPKTTIITLSFDLNPHEHILEKEIIASVNTPDTTLVSQTIHGTQTTIYNAHTKQEEVVLAENFKVAVTVEKHTTKNIPAQLRITASSNQAPQPKSYTFPLAFMPSETEHSTTIHHPSDQQEKVAHPTSNHETTSFIDSLKNYQDDLKKHIAHTDSWVLRLLLAYILGLLLSLTPCIYPMIPITVGVLQSQGSTSVIRNFLLSLCYTLGLGTTFSLMGLLAASSGEAFGSIMVNPIFVVCIIAFLSYFAFSLFGFYNLYIPRFMQQKSSISQSGSAVSIFIFGLASGSVASPCLSPGLALILTMVATMANKALGFLLLFAFGFGISTPLLIIGTFSGSINLLPRAGTWMMEIQKVFGFMLLGMCFYYASNIIPWIWILAGLTLFFFIMSVYYFRAGQQNKSYTTLYTIIGSLALITSVFVGLETVQQKLYPEVDTAFERTWYTSYEQALTDAQEQKKLLFIDFWTPYCSICKAITKTILKNPRITKILQDHYIILSVDASDAQTEPYKTLKATYDTWGAPNLLIIDPVSKKELKRWQSEMYDMSIDAVAQELTEYSTQS